MEALDAFNFLGSLISIAGGAVAWWQAKRSRTAAQEAQAAREELISRRRASEVAQMLEAGRSVQGLFSKYGPAATNYSLKGANVETDAPPVQTFVLRLQENLEILAPGDRNQVEETCRAILRDLASFSETQTDPARMKIVGSDILTETGTRSLTSGELTARFLMQ